MTNILLIVIFTVLTCLCIAPVRKYMIINPIVGFLIFNWIMGVGSINQFDLENDTDLLHLFIIFITPLLFSGGVLFTLFKRNPERSYKYYLDSELGKETNSAGYLYVTIFIISIIAAALYYHALGYNLFIASLVGSGVDDFTSQRLEAYSGDAYFAPGYVNQFKNTLYPVLFFIFLFNMKFNKNRWHSAFLIIFGSWLVITILGTGQRTFLVFTVIMFIYCYFAVNRGKVALMPLVILGVSGLIIFFFITVLLGRTTGVGTVNILDSIYFRAFVSNQESSVNGFRFISNQTIPFGSDWFQPITNLLTGSRGQTTIANEIHAYLYGSSRGTAPLSLWGSAYYNFGLLGVLIVPSLLGSLYTIAYLNFLKNKHTIASLCIYSGIFFYMSTWVNDGPFQLINNGLFTLYVLLFMRKIANSIDYRFLRH